MVDKILSKIGTAKKRLETNDEGLIMNTKKRLKYNKKYAEEIDQMEKDLEPFREKDEKVMHEKVHFEVENSLLFVMDKKVKLE